MFVGLIGLFAGCSEDGASPSEDDLAAIADEFGGYTPTDEAAAFGDPDLIEDIEAIPILSRILMPMGLMTTIF